MAALLVASWKARNDGLIGGGVSDRRGAALGNGGGRSASAASRQHMVTPSSRRGAPVSSSASRRAYFRRRLQDLICCLHACPPRDSVLWQALGCVPAVCLSCHHRPVSGQADCTLNCLDVIVSDVYEKARETCSQVRCGMRTFLAPAVATRRGFLPPSGRLSRFPALSTVANCGTRGPGPLPARK